MPPKAKVEGSKQVFDPRDPLKYTVSKDTPLHILEQIMAAKKQLKRDEERMRKTIAAEKIAQKAARIQNLFDYDNYVRFRDQLFELCPSKRTNIMFDIIRREIYNTINMKREMSESTCGLPSGYLYMIHDQENDKKTIYKKYERELNLLKTELEALDSPGARDIVSLIP